MKLTDKAGQHTPQSVIVYGAPKSGKTELVGKLSEKFNLIWFDLENGYETLLKLPPEQQARIDLIHLPDSRTYPIAVETMLKVVKGKPCNICDTHGKVECAICKKDPDATFTLVNLGDVPSDTIVVIDSLTQYTNSAIANITKNQPDDYKMQFDDWGNLKVLVEKLLSELQAAPYHLVCISHEEEVEMQDKKKKIVPVCGSSKSSRNTAKYFGHAVYCEVKNKKHVAASSTTYMNNILTGSRSDISLEDGSSSLIDIFLGNTGKQASAPATDNKRTSSILSNLKKGN